MPQIERVLAARELFPPVAFAPYAEPEPVCTCGACGGPVYEGEKIYFDGKTGCLLGCGHCIDFRLV